MTYFCVKEKNESVSSSIFFICEKNTPEAGGQKGGKVPAIERKKENCTIHRSAPHAKSPSGIRMEPTGGLGDAPAFRKKG